MREVRRKSELAAARMPMEKHMVKTWLKQLSVSENTARHRVHYSAARMTGLSKFLLVRM